MAIKIVTDGTADIPPRLVKELDITVVPLYVLFGDKSYRGGIDISSDEFYEKLVHGNVHPTTSQPTPQDFVKVYEELGSKCDGILSIHISTKLSGTVNSAEQAKKLVKTECPIEVIDSLSVSMSFGLMVIAVARMAKAGKELAEVTVEAKKMVANIKLLALFDTLVYLARGGRIGKAKSLVGSLLNVKPLLTLKEGEFHPVGQVRNHAKGKEKLLEFVNGIKDIEDMTVLHSTTPEEAKDLADSINSVPKSRIYLARIGPVLGVHGGPGLLAVAIRTKS
jgi:DegV family protein with EDD domain